MFSNPPISPFIKVGVIHRYLSKKGKRILLFAKEGQGEITKRKSCAKIHSVIPLYPFFPHSGGFAAAKEKWET
jgi:hypothetical protein